MSQEEYKEYDTIMIPLSSGKDQEFAIMEEFDFEEQHYIVVAVVKEDVIQEGQYIYRAKIEGDTVMAERIEDADEYDNVIEYYQTLD